MEARCRRNQRGGKKSHIQSIKHKHQQGLLCCDCQEFPADSNPIEARRKVGGVNSLAPEAPAFLKVLDIELARADTTHYEYTDLVYSWTLHLFLNNEQLCTFLWG